MQDTTPRPGATRSTSVQSLPSSIDALLAHWREILAPREYAVVLDITARIVEAELQRNATAQERWAA